MKRGFTLVELSIVLIIIGLLIGGILVASSMITTTKINKGISEIQQFDVMIGNFRTKYNQLPGDGTAFAGNGDNNGLIDESVFRYEYTYAWQHLSQAEMLKNYKGNSYAYWDPVGYPTSQVECPKLSIDNNPANPATLILHDFNHVGTSKNYYYYFQAPNGVFNNGTASDPVRASDALAIDMKLDNGLPASGKMIANTVGSGTTSACRNGTSYNATATGYSCTLYIEVGVLNNNNAQN